MTGRGVAYARKRAKERQSKFSSPFLFLRENGERARIRFLTDVEEFYQGMFHRPYIDGKMYDPVLCPEQDDNPPAVEGMGEECDLCGPDRSNPSYKYFAWVYVYHILHPNQNPRLEKDSNAPKWKAVKVGKGAGAATFYKQEVNKVKMLLFGQTIFDDLVVLSAGDDEDEDSEATGLLTRDYSFVRNGARKDPKTTYTFVPARKETDISAAVKEAIDKLGDLEESALAGTKAHYSDEDTSTSSSDKEEAEEIEAEDEPEEAEEEVEVADEEDYEDL